jgi:hypothetical protein
MATEIDPIEGDWYQHLDKGQCFTVISIDEEQKNIEVQHFDGDLESIDQDSWYEMDLAHIEPPEDWTGPIDELELDDLGIDTSDMQPEDWAAPLDEFPKDT